MKIWTAIVAIVCAAVLSGFTPWLRGAVTIIPSSIISSVGPATASYTTGILTNTVIAPVSVTMSPATPTFSGTLALSGTTNFALSSSTLPANIIANGTTPTCTSATPFTFNLVATQAGATGSPYTQSVTVTCNPPAGAFYVQGITHQNGSPSSTTVVAVLPSTVGVGDTVFITLGWSGTSNTVTSIIDDKLNTYTPVDLQVNTAFSYTWVSGYAVNITNGPKTITATLSAPAPFASIIVDEFSGIPTTATLDNHAINNQSGLAPGTNAITSPVVSIVGGDFVYGASVNVPGNGTESAGTGFTVTQHTPSAFISEYQNGATAGSKAATFTSTVSSDWLTYMLALKSGGGGGGGGSTIASVSPAAASYTTGVTTGTTVSPISVTMSPATPAFSGTLSLTGTTNFAISSSTLPSNLTATSTTPTCTTSTPQTPFNIVATQAGATGSPFTQPVTVTCNPVGSLTTTSLFKSTDTPGSIDSADTAAGVYGVQFTPQTSGNATGCKFYKASTNTGTHVCTLWTSSGTQLATVTFSGETASGWQTQNFSSSVALTAGTQYVIGVWDPAGHYSDDPSFFNTQYVSDVDGQILAPATGSTTNGKGNGVYSQVTSTTFPTLTFNATNYWADVVYQYTPVPQSIATLALSSTSITNNAPSGFTVGTASASMSPTTPVFSGSFSLSQTQGGCNSTNGVNNSSFVFSGDGVTLKTSVANIATGPYSICVLATQAGATNNPQGQPFIINSAPQTISAISLSSTFFPPSTAGPVGTASATVTPSPPAFSGTWSIPTSGSVTGSTWSSGTGGTLCDTSGFFTVSGNTVNVSASATTTTYHVCLIATQSGATGSPYAAVMNLLGTTGGATAFTPLHTYFLSPTGSDSNNGTSAATPWASANHALVCGDVIIAAAGSYAGQFMGNFGTVSNCPSTTGGIDGTGGIYFATILCAGPDLHSCNLDCASCDGGTNGVFDISKNYWAVEGFNITTSGSPSRGFNPNSTALTDIWHHFAFVNNVIYNTNSAASDNECPAGNCTANVPGNGIDYYAIIGNIAQNAARDTICLAAIDIVGPAVADTVAGTHFLVYGNFSYNTTSNGCSIDEEPFMFDTFDAHAYNQQTVLLNNMAWSGWRHGFNVFIQTYNATGAMASNALTSLFIYELNNTAYNNDLSGDGLVGDFYVQQENNSLPHIILNNNIAGSTSSTGGCAMTVGGNPQNLYLGNLANVNTGTVGNENILFNFNGGSVECPFQGYVFSANNWPENPGFTNTTDLLANRTTQIPNCTGFVNTTACMGWNAVTQTLTTPSVISDLTPSSTHSAGKGYRRPSVTCGSINAPDGTALYPTWLKGIVYLHWTGSSIIENADLVTKPCGM